MPAAVLAVAVTALLATVLLVVVLVEEALHARREAAFFSNLRPALIELRTGQRHH